MALKYGNFAFTGCFPSLNFIFLCLLFNLSSASLSASITLSQIIAELPTILAKYFPFSKLQVEGQKDSKHNHFQ